MLNFKKDYNFKIICVALNVIALLATPLYSHPVSGNTLRVPSFFKNSANEKRTEDILNGKSKNKEIEFNLSNDFRINSEYSARLLLPYSNLLVAVNIILLHENISNISSIAFDLNSSENFAEIEGGRLKIYLKDVEKLEIADILLVLKKNLGWDFLKAIKKAAGQYPYLLMSKDFETVNVILHRRMAGLGDLVFVANTAQVLSRAFPDKKIRLIFHTKEDFELVCKTKLIKGLDINLDVQKIEGVEIINAGARGEWYSITDTLIGKNDVSIVYALGGDEKDVFNHESFFRRCSGRSKVHIPVHELGFASLIRNPLESGEVHLGFGEDSIGLPPISPKGKDLYTRKYPRKDDKIREERKRIIKKFEGWQQLDSLLGQIDLERTVNSEWGFLYSHETNSVKHYFNIFKEARGKDPKYSEQDTTFFLMCGRQNHKVHQEIRDISGAEKYNLFVYSDEERTLEPVNINKDSNVTIIMDYSVPRKLFSELFLYSDDLPTLVSGQDNFSNIVYLNLLSTGRPFFWEVLVFQWDAMFETSRFLEKNIGREEAKCFVDIVGLGRAQNPSEELIFNPQNDEKGAFISGSRYDHQLRMFSSPREYRMFFKKIATTLDRHVSFVPQMYYLILQQLQKKSYFAASKHAEELISELNRKDLQLMEDGKFLEEINKNGYLLRSL